MPLAELPFTTLREVFKFLPVSDLSTLDNVCLYLKLALPSFYHTFTPTQLDIFDSKSHLKRRQVAFAPDGSIVVVTLRGTLVRLEFSGRAKVSALQGVSGVVSTRSTLAAIANSKSIKICQYPGLFDFGDCPLKEEVSEVISSIGNSLLVATERSEILLVDGKDISRLPRVPDGCLAKGSISDLAMIDSLGARCIYVLLSDGRLMRHRLRSVMTSNGELHWETVNRRTQEISCDDFRVHHHDGSVLNDDMRLVPERKGQAQRILGIRATGAGLLAAVQGRGIFVWRAKQKVSEIELDTPVELLVDFAIRETQDNVELALYFGEFVRCVELVWIEGKLVEIDNRSLMVSY